MSHEETILHFPAGMRWSCQSCGLCCRSFWEIPVGSGDIQRLAALPLGRIDPQFAAGPPLGQSAVHPDRSVLRLVDKHCCFLSPDNRCSIHSVFGEAAKPAPCREFPFLFLRAPDGLYVGLTFACPNVVDNLGQPVEERTDWVRSHVSRAFAVVSLPETIELTEGLPLDWADYLLVEQSLLRLLRTETIPLEDRLIAGSAWLGMLDLFLRQTLNGTDLPVRDVIRGFADSMERTSYDRVLRVARSSAQSPFLQRMFLGMMIAFRNSLTVRRGRLNVVGTILWNYFRHAMRLGRIRLAPLDQTFRYSDFRRARFDPNEPAAAALIERYVAHMVFRKDLVRHGDVAGGYHLLLLAFALARWYAVGLAAGRGDRRVGIEDVKKAISLTEQYYVAHSTFLHLFERYPVLNGVFFNVVRRRNFAHSLVREAV